jgi:hypothetical protein
MKKTDPKSDPVLDELHSIRSQLHDECQGDLAAMVAEMRDRQKTSGHPIVPLPISREFENSTAR